MNKVEELKKEYDRWFIRYQMYKFIKWSMNELSDVPHLYNAGMGSIKHFLNMNPKDDNERLINLEYIERMQPIMKKYKNNMENFKKTLANK